MRIETEKASGYSKLQGDPVAASANDFAKYNTEIAVWFMITWSRHLFAPRGPQSEHSDMPISYFEDLGGEHHGERIELKATRPNPNPDGTADYREFFEAERRIYSAAEKGHVNADT